jgi:subtilisin
VSSVEPTSQPPSASDKPSKKASASSNVLASRENQYLITTQASGFGFHTLSIEQVQQALERMPNVRIVKTLTPRGFAALATDLIGAAKTLVAEMPYEQYVTLKQSVPRSVIVEPDFIYGITGPVAPATREPGVIPLQPKPFAVTIQVAGTNNAPLADALVVVYGSGIPAQGITDANGSVTVTVYGGTLETVAALYVKPAADHWETYVQQPRLQDGVSNLVQVTPLSDSFPTFPQHPMHGWGQRAMNLDKLPSEFTGKGVKVAVIDSGCDTHPVGTIAGTAARNGIRGCAPEAEVLVYKVSPRGAVSDIIAALHECMAEQVDIVNLSLGGEQVSQALEIELGRAKSLGIACIVAAGDTAGAVQYPASSPNVFAVAAIGKTGEFPPSTYHARQMVQGGTITSDGYFAAAFSAHGPEIKVCAPGVAIVSSVPPRGFAAWDGTSTAGAHITGLAALILAHHPSFGSTVFSQRNAARVDELFRNISASARPLDLGDPSRTGAGLPDAQRALTVSQAVPAGPITLTDVIASLRSMVQQTGGARVNGNGAQAAGSTQSPSTSPPAAAGGGAGLQAMAAPGIGADFATPRQARDFLIKEMRGRMQAAGVFR